MKEFSLDDLAKLNEIRKKSEDKLVLEAEKAKKAEKSSSKTTMWDAFDRTSACQHLRCDSEMATSMVVRVAFL